MGHSETHRLAMRMAQLTSWLEAQEGLVKERYEFHAPPRGCVHVTIDPGSVSPAASFNHNCICLCGAAGGLSREGLVEILALFTARGIDRLFAWLSPGPDQAQVRTWLGSMSFVPVRWTRYPTMLLAEPPVPRPVAGFEIRQIYAAELAAVGAALGDVVMEGFARTIGKPDFFHYVALDGQRPIAVAALAQFGELGYLTYAGTATSDRRRGAQTALIAHRVAVAKSLGCTHIVSRTLTMLEDSFANLTRCGFREIFEQEVYEFRRS